MDQSNLRGQCHCGKVVYRVTGPVKSFDHCHCNTCRRIHGTVYGSSAEVAATDFEILQGEDALTAYASSAAKQRLFCRYCGSHLYARPSDPEAGYLLIRVGTLDPGHGLKPDAHIFLSDKPDWYEIDERLTQYPGNLPD